MHVSSSAGDFMGAAPYKPLLFTQGEEVDTQSEQVDGGDTGNSGAANGDAADSAGAGGQLEGTTTRFLMQPLALMDKAPVFFVSQFTGQGTTDALVSLPTYLALSEVGGGERGGVRDRTRMHACTHTHARAQGRIASIEDMTFRHFTVQLQAGASETRIDELVVRAAVVSTHTHTPSRARPRARRLSCDPSCCCSPGWRSRTSGTAWGSWRRRRTFSPCSSSASPSW